MGRVTCSLIRPARCAGAVFRMVLEKPPLRQKAPLEMLMVLALEIAATSDEDLRTRLICGYC